MGASDGSGISPPGLHNDEDEEFSDDILSDADAVASLNGELFSEEEDDPPLLETSTRPMRGWRIKHSSGNYKYKRLS